MPDESSLAGKDFWEGFWTHGGGRSFRNFSYSFHYFTRLLEQFAPAGSSALELGCGGSVWMPALAARRVDTWGIDYSDIGVDITRQALDRQGVRATVVKGDIFDVEALPAARFDLVFSLGVIEHFSNPAAFLARARDLCRPGGIVVTQVPNFGGTWGAVQRRIDPEFYAAHRIYDRAALDRVHAEAGLTILRPAAYAGGISPLLVNYSRIIKKMPPLVARAAVAVTWLGQQGVCWSTALLPQAIHNPPTLAAHIVGVYQRPK